MANPPVRRIRGSAATIAVTVGLLGAMIAGAAQAGAAAHAENARPTLASAGTNLLANGDAEFGQPTLSGYDAVTIPGWQVRQGLPTVAMYGEGGGFPGKNQPGPTERGTNLFAGGAGGTSILTQTVDVGSAAPAGATFELSGWLGGRGNRTDAASVQLSFRSAGGASLGTATLGPVTPADRGNATGLLHRARGGAVPAGTRTIDVALTMTTTNRNYDTHFSSVVGYNRAYADDLSLTLSIPAKAPQVTPPPAHVPHFDHVFFTVMENQNFNDVIGNTAEAPFLNSLLAKGALLGNFFAEAHWSDPNYLAFSGGSTFGILHDPIEGNPQYTIDARNIGDLVEDAGQSWKGYAQSAHGPCDNTIHGAYYNDDMPFLYYRDIKDDPARCDAHLVPWADFGTDLQRATTTPNFVWMGPNDYYDMEGGGISAGDTFLRQALTKVFRSPAWTDQRSLLVITFDEDYGNGERPAQLVPTIVLGSQDVKQGYESLTRTTHYGLLRMVEGALGLGTLTSNDRYATVPSDIFDH